MLFFFFFGDLCLIIFYFWDGCFDSLVENKSYVDILSLLLFFVDSIIEICIGNNV